MTMPPFGIVIRVLPPAYGTVWLGGIPYYYANNVYVSYLSVVIAQSGMLGSESNLLLLRNRRLAAINRLLKNIAGRWDTP